MDQPFDYKTPTSQEEEFVSVEPVQIQPPPPSYYERKDLLHTANIIGLSACGMIATRFLLPVIIDLYAVISVALGWNFLDPATNEIISIIYTCFFILIPFLLVFKLGGFHISRLMSFEIPKKKNTIAYIFMSMGFCAFANIMVSVSGAFFSLFDVEYELSSTPNPQGFLGFMLTFISTAVFPPLIEEFVCRGLVLGSLKRFGNGFAIVVSSIVFGIIHGNFKQIPFAFLVGLGLGFITVKTGSLWAAIIVHSFNNAVSVLFSYADGVLDSQLYSIINLLYFIVAMLIGLLGVFMLNHKKDAYTFEKVECELALSNRYLWFFSCPMIVVIIGYNIYNAFLYFKI